MRTLAVAGVMLIGTTVCLADDAIPLPSSLDIHPCWRDMFPPSQDFYAEKHSTGRLEGIHGRDRGRLDGPSVTLYESGALKTLGGYAKGMREGTFRVWDEKRRLVFYSQYKKGKKDGITCVLSGGEPWLVQKWKEGELEKESLDDPAAHERLVVVEEELAETEQDVRTSLYDWFTETDRQVKEQNFKALKPMKKADLAAKRQRARQEEADVVAGAHPSRRIRGAARAIAADAGANSKAAAKAADARAKEAKQALQRRDAEMMEESRETYEFAMKALEGIDKRSFGN